MQGWNISTRIAVYVGGTTALLLCINCALSLHFEVHQERDFLARYEQKIDQSILERETAAQGELAHYIDFTTQILAGIVNLQLYNLNKTGVQETLRAYLQYPEIVAIQVWDDTDISFAAIWKTGADFHEGAIIPSELSLDTTLVKEMDALYEERKVGRILVVYNDNRLKMQTQEILKRSAGELENFQRESQGRIMQTAAKEVIGGVCILLALVLSQLIFLRRLIFRPLLNVSMMARRLSRLDLSVSVKKGRLDEIGRMYYALDDMIQSFKNVIGQVQNSGVQMSSSSTELAATAKQQEITIKTRMEAIEQAVHDVQGISEVAAQLVDTMRHVGEMTEETAQFANSSQSNLARMQAAMRTMEQASSSISERLGAINEKAENITTVVTTIHKVADQTNLLSLNASIEAEKAGEYGRGFTVVAREIRRLADQTAVATLDIEHMVKEMQAAVSSGVMGMDKFIAEVRRNAEDVDNISEQLGRIIMQVQSLSPRFEEVTGAMGNQSNHAREISYTMLDLSREMQQTTRSLHESFAAIEQLNDATRGLQSEVSRFKVSDFQ